MTQLGFMFNSTRCSGCKTCQVSCKERYSLPVENLWRKVYEYQGGAWVPHEETGWYTADGIFGYRISIACNHCLEPACVANCPTGAMQKDEGTGIVWTDHEVCIGCKTCQTVCPYGAPSYSDAEGYMTKCDLCKDSVESGDTPLCVKSCPMRALDFGDFDELKAQYGEGDVEIEPLPINSTNPAIVLLPHKEARPSGTDQGAVVNLEQEFKDE